ncbi:MAG: hypothetical protein Q8N96_07600, partial [Methylovulum sp.]|nr:hypothetical protein [Methylovulum sp.]
NKTTRVSVNTDGLPVDAFSFSTSPALSASGRFVVFASRATNLVPNDTNYATDIFVNDQLTGKTNRISVDSSGNEGNGNSHFIELENPWLTDTGICACFTLFDPFAIGSGTPAISADGRFLAFDSYASNLVAADMNTSQDVFLHDQNTGKTRRVSVDSRGKEARLGSGFPSLSADARTLVFASKGAIMDVQYSIFNPVERIYAKDLYVNSGKNADEARGRAESVRIRNEE